MYLMKVKSQIVLLACVVILSFSLTGCAKKVNKEWAATGGSRESATIVLSYRYNPQAEIPILNDEQGLELAKARCRSWGFRSAEAFGGENESVEFGLTNSVWTGPIGARNVVTKQYQCLGRDSGVSK
jgi:type IV pilus biogenesis protein CpaD/CtpE